VVVVSCVFVAQVIAVGPLPVPHAPLAFVGAIPIAIVEPPPPPRPHIARSAASPDPPGAAPIAPPDGVRPEAPRPERYDNPVGAIDGVEGGINGLSGARIDVPPPAPPPPPPQPPMRLHSGMQPPRKAANVDPLYPAVARSAHVEGVVILEAVIDAQGRVESVRVLRSIPLLDQAAIDAVKQWTFTPALLNGMPVPVVMTVTVNFQLTR